MAYSVTSYVAYVKQLLVWGFFPLSELGLEDEVVNPWSLLLSYYYKILHINIYQTVFTSKPAKGLKFWDNDKNN